MNVTMLEDGKTLRIDIPMDVPPQPSGSGKTLVVASTHGNVKVANMTVNGKTLTVGVNAYIAR